MTIIDEIHEKAANISEHDLDEWIVPNLANFYTQRIRSLSKFAYGSSETVEAIELAHAAFRERAKAELRNATRTYLFVSEHWRTGRDLNSYLLLSLKRLASRIRIDIESARKSNQPICPACKALGDKQFCKYESRLLRCYACISEINRLEDDLKLDLKTTERDRIEGEIRLRKVFQVHSRRGHRCPDCHRFIPDTFVQQYGVSCPYPDCAFYGTAGELEPMAHPLGLGFQSPMSLNQPVFKSDQSGHLPPEWQDILQSNDINADVQIEVKESCNQKLDVLNQVIDDQIAKIKRNETEEHAILKLLMYQAYKNLVQRQPDDMIHYLVHMRHTGDLPIQSVIFQEYIKLIENNLPFKIAKGKRTFEIESLLDPNLNLFLGTSKYTATVRSDHAVINNTIETYTGGRKLKFFGPCFIGLLVDVVHRGSGQSLRDNVKSYSFVQIKMDDTVPEGTPVEVTHFRIASHYEMGGLVHLQRIRRKIVDSVFYRLHGKKRRTKADKYEEDKEAD